jgi:hypothetical protein
MVVLSTFYNFVTKITKNFWIYREKFFCIVILFFLYAHELNFYGDIGDKHILSPHIPHYMVVLSVTKPVTKSFLFLVFLVTLFSLDSKFLLILLVKKKRGGVSVSPKRKTLKNFF